MPVISLPLESPLPFAQEEFQIKIRSERDAVQERIAGQRGDGFLLAIPQHNFDFWPSQPLRLDEGFEIGSVRSPMIDHDSSWMKFQKVERAATDDQPDDSLAIARGQLRQPFGGTI